ncbi:MAG: VapE domain-containing protein, partial [Alphaproteobacteria bacterium]
MSEDQNKALDELFGVVSSEAFEYELPAKDELIKNTLQLRAGYIVNSQANATDMVMAEPALKGRLKHELFSGRTFIDLPIAGITGLDKIYSPISNMCTTVDLADEHVRAIHYHLEKKYQCTLSERYVGNGLAQLASQKRYDAAINYLEECERLADEDVSGFAEDEIAYHLGIPEDMLTSEYVLYTGHVIPRWLTAMVARSYIPGYKHDWCLTLPGAQGVGKSGLLRILAGGPQFFKDDLPADLKSKDAKQGLRGVLVAEMAEFTQNKKNEQEVFKAFITTQEDRFRPAYGKYDVVVPRRTVFAITTNKQSF